MAVVTNKTKKKSVAMDTSIPSKSPETKPSFNVEPIDNGWILTKSWCDKTGRYCSEKRYVDENPLAAIFDDKKKDKD